MDMILTRKDFEDYGIFSELSTIQGTFFSVMGSHAYPDEKDGNKPKPVIPNGVWKFVRFLSPHFGYDLFVCNDIPGHDLLELHIGNWPQKDSHGCELFGEFVGPGPGKTKIVTNSKTMFDKFMLMQTGVDSLSLTVE